MINGLRNAPVKWSWFERNYYRSGVKFSTTVGNSDLEQNVLSISTKTFVARVRRFSLTVLMGSRNGVEDWEGIRRAGHALFTNLIFGRAFIRG